MRLAFPSTFGQMGTLIINEQKEVLGAFNGGNQGEWPGRWAPAASIQPWCGEPLPRDPLLLSPARTWPRWYGFHASCTICAISNLQQCEATQALMLLLTLAHPSPAHPFPQFSHPLLLGTSPVPSFFSSHAEQTALFRPLLHRFCYFVAKPHGSLLPISSHSASHSMSTASVLGQAIGGPCTNTGWHCLNSKALLTWGHLEVWSEGYGEFKEGMRWRSRIGLSVRDRERPMCRGMGGWGHQVHRFHSNKKKLRTSLVAQWLRIRLPMQGTWVWSLVQEDPTCHGATKPVRHSYWARVLQLLKPECPEPVLHNKRSHGCEKTVQCNEE